MAERSKAKDRWDMGIIEKYAGQNGKWCLFTDKMKHIINILGDNKDNIYLFKH